MTDTASRSRAPGRRRALRLIAAAPVGAPLLAAGAGRADAAAPAESPVAPGLLRVYLARHGQTDWNRERRLQGGTDTKLNETGVAQAQALAHLMAGLAFDAVYSSALERSRRTAEIVAAGRGVEELPGLNEQRLGAFEGLFLDGRERQREAEYSSPARDVSVTAAIGRAKALRKQAGRSTAFGAASESKNPPGLENGGRGAAAATITATTYFGTTTVSMT